MTIKNLFKFITCHFLYILQNNILNFHKKSEEIGNDDLDIKIYLRNSRNFF